MAYDIRIKEGSLNTYSKTGDTTVFALDPNGKEYAIMSPQPARLRSVSVGGDSYSARNHQAFIPSAVSCVNGVITATSASHALSTGEFINSTGALIEAANVVKTAITKIDANNISYPAPGTPDGVVVSGPATVQFTAWQQQTCEGIFPHLNRIMGAGLRLVANAGCSGYKMLDYEARYPKAIAPFSADLHIHWGYFNDCQFAISAANSAEAVQRTLIKRKAQGSLCVVVSALPIPSGVWTWPAGYGMTDTKGAQFVVQWNRLMRDFCAKNYMVFIDIHSVAVDRVAGFALAGYCKAADIHPSQKTNYLVAKMIKAELASFKVSPYLLACSGIDNVGADATNRNVCRFAPVSQGTGGGGNTTVTYTAWAIGAIPALRWRTNAGHLYYTVAGGTAVAPGPTHTAGAVADAGGVLWMYMGEVIGTAGVAQGWSASMGGNANSACMTTLIDDGSGGKLMRIFAYAAAANDQLTISYIATATDVTPGDIVNAAAVFSIGTQMNASPNNTPAAQGLKAITSEFAITVDGIVYVPIEMRGSSAASNEQIPEDITNQVMSLKDVLVPVGASGGAGLTSFRYQFLIQSSAAGVYYFDVGYMTITH